MLGFGKKKKEKNAAAQPETTDAGEQEKTSAAKGDAPKSKPAKKKFTLKKIMILVAIFLAVGGSAFVVYTLYFKGAGGEDGERIYEKKILNHSTLPEEMLQFCFQRFPELYDAMVEYNSEMDLIGSEIERIAAIGEKYPEQIKIVDKETKYWTKISASLEKVFLKLEKPIKETYVLFRVNEAAGLEQIEAKSKDLTSAAQAALETAKQETQKLKTGEAAPDGLIKGTVYKIKKKFL